MKTLKVLAYDIDYDVNEEDIETDINIVKTVEEIKAGLPKALRLEVEVEDPEDEDEVQDAIVHEISEITYWLVNSYKYEIINSVETAITKDRVLAAQRVLWDNGIDADETSTVIDAVLAVLLDEDFEDEIEWEAEKIPYNMTIWE